MTEKDLHTETVIRDYHQVEGASFRTQVSSGVLYERESLDGRVYTLHLETGDFAVAIVKNDGLTVRAGDEVFFRRSGPSKADIKATACISDFRVNDNNHEIVFTSYPQITSVLRTSDIVANHSATLREFRNERS